MVKKFKRIEFLEIVNDILINEDVQKLNLYKHHYAYTRLEHSMSVAYYSYVICKIFHLDYESIARAGLLHDLFFYDCENKLTRPKNHISNHSKIALKNAEKLFSLNDKEKDIILKHMWPITLSRPKYIESFIITFVDKYCALKEWSYYCGYMLLNYYSFYFKKRRQTF